MWGGEWTEYKDIVSMIRQCLDVSRDVAFLAAHPLKSGVDDAQAALPWSKMIDSEDRNLDLSSNEMVP